MRLSEVFADIVHFYYSYCIVFLVRCHFVTTEQNIVFTVISLFNNGAKLTT